MSVSQDSIAAALLDADRPAPEGLRDPANRPAGARFDVYRNNVAVSLTEAMLTAFPVVTRLLGEENMRGLAGIFLRAHRPDTPLMMHYGAGFPGFLADSAQLAHLGYLPDVARLELALRRAYHAADAAPVDTGRLAAMSPDELMGCTLSLAPAVEFLRSRWPVFDIWRFNTQEDAPRPRAMAQDVLLTRPDFDPVPHLLPDGGAAWIAAITAGRSLGEAQDAALAVSAGFDLAPLLALLLQGGAIASFGPTGRPPGTRNP
ncbi:DNA-binding domain-containing protein [Pukyongiella litopenaei]|uniref:DUF2063 domain-containing protein n=1 Tax=Pukyongiella litopenaei TaxID=2605946 RepID=A0A2S0MTY9_9RHOB|nr:DNA-binding domain-containing protein [Pukyongiella litopenaei]AVO39359.1 DUF2063 domain-containing protein [Pukyongiella litopenaei]